MRAFRKSVVIGNVLQAFNANVYHAKKYTSGFFRHVERGTPWFFCVCSGCILHFIGFVEIWGVFGASGRRLFPRFADIENIARLIWAWRCRRENGAGSSVYKCDRSSVCFAVESIYDVSIFYDAPRLRFPTGENCLHHFGVEQNRFIRIAKLLDRKVLMVYNKNAGRDTRKNFFC